MSFGEYSVNSGTASQGGSSEYNRLCGCVSNNIQAINKNVSTIQKLVDKLGTSEDKSQLQSRLQQTEQATQKLAKETTSYFKQLPHLYGESPSDRRQRKLQVEKLRDNFTAALNNFQQVQREAAEKEKASVSRARSMSAGMPTPSAMGGYTDEHGLAEHDRTAGGLQVQGEEEISTELIEERERAIRQLEGHTYPHPKRNSFLPCDLLIKGGVPLMCANEFTPYLQKLPSVQKHYIAKAARKKMCCILVILVVAAAALGLIIYFATK
ncbi:unnamed protein product [Porites evermanni]|uniref:Syntaxin N-terminal domain-containing protein n=1 Tax=Porites evermanni TaxID=104178 RepID=A0ABN8R9D8_9CNID|nr:unnamed protein product [Porites evermanni]